MPGSRATIASLQSSGRKTGGATVNSRRVLKAKGSDGNGRCEGFRHVGVHRQPAGRGGFMNGDIVLLLVTAFLFALFVASIWFFQEV
jgi:hypothetical protein